MPGAADKHEDQPAPALPGGTQAEHPHGQLDQELTHKAKKLNLVAGAQLARAIDGAVREGLEAHFHGDDEALQAAIETIGRGLWQRLKAESRAVRGLPKQAFLREVQADKRRIEAQREKARGELEGLLGELQAQHVELDRVEALVVRESREAAQVQDRAIASHISQLFEECDSPEDFERVRAEVTTLTLHSLQGEREKAIEAQLTEQKREVDQYRRRVAKLTSSLEMTEDELRRIAAQKNIDLGVQSIYRTVQGLAHDDSSFEVKKELMSSIFQANLDLQKPLAAGARETGANPAQAL
ncbi:MAG TPA: hypothetical protein EYG30_12395 [Planctomycetes bacterium]|jgi:chromosome segregation ATPase|nr:hypothetical protein [Planctomycetota bacterium]HIL53039.1 hypothetical protein [Planctomycetota bacterium]